MRRTVDDALLWGVWRVRLRSCGWESVAAWPIGAAAAIITLGVPLIISVVVLGFTSVPRSSGGPSMILPILPVCAPEVTGEGATAWARSWVGWGDEARP